MKLVSHVRDMINKGNKSAILFVCAVPLIIFALVCFIASVTVLSVLVDNHRYNSKEIESDVPVSLYEISVRGERHEYIATEYGIIHLQNCRYCKSILNTKDK